MSEVEIIIALKIALFSAVWIEYLTVEGAILEFYLKALDKIPEWIAKPLGKCQYCFGGQIALWYYFISTNEYNFINHVTIICLTILLIDIFQKIIVWSKN